MTADIDRQQPLLELGQLLLADDGIDKKGRPVIYAVSFVGKTRARLVANFSCMSATVTLRGNRLPADWEILDNYTLARRLEDERHPPNPA